MIAFLRRHPDVSVRLVGSNSSAIAERVRRGELEAGVVLLPIDDDRLDVRPIVRDEVLYVSASARAHARPATIERLAETPLVFYDAESADDDPIRRQLAERAQALGMRLQPKVEVELKDIALRLVAAGIGDTYLPSAYTRAPYYPDGLSTDPFSPPLYDTFAIITRPGARLSPGVRELLAELEAHMRARRRRVRPVPLRRLMPVQRGLVRGRPRLGSGAACWGIRPASVSARRSSISTWALRLRSSSPAQRTSASWTAGSSRSRTCRRSLTYTASRR